eukprot:1154663-Pelagomonas_calceolata.AAC.1
MMLTAWLITCKGQLQVQVTFELRTCYMQMTCLTANHPTELQIMLGRLHGYAQRKGLKINVSKSEVVHLSKQAAWLQEST